MKKSAEQLRALARLSRSAPTADPLETEIRSQGAPNFKTEPNSDFSEAVAIVASWEWHYGVPQSDIEDFIEFLQDEEMNIVDLMRTILPDAVRQIDYRGTFISATGERGWYECRTVWSYEGDTPVFQWVALLGNAQFLLLFLELRRRWAADPGATERLWSLLGLYTYDDDFVDEDEDIAAGQRAIMKATAAAIKAAPPGKRSGNPASKKSPKAIKKKA